VHKLTLSGLDPTILIGFVVQDEAKWADLRRRIKEVHHIPYLAFGM
jgi:hypothetical protein